MASDSACDAILAAYLRAWRPGHLSVSALAPADAAARVADVLRVQRWLESGRL